MSMIAAIIFDMDGVLMDSEPLHLRATRFALGVRAQSYTERDNQSFFGATDPEMFRILRILFDLDATTDELVLRKREHLVSLIRSEGRGLPGVPEIPLRFRDAGLRLGLVSASARPVIDAILQAVGLHEAFETVVSGDEVARGKPAPDGYLMAARRLGVDPRGCFVVEDARNGVLAAKAAGMTVAAVPGPATSHEDFSPADLVLPSLEALPKVLERNGSGRNASGREP
ncbi:MAG TPA: HAD family phosphatase [Methylomirabilota bacterium]|jgi:beta-phosphoglucomutase-like phosphatase (HAD superfamily)|nr:HAD family phosphatase [Methylomirabilota bacterium]